MDPSAFPRQLIDICVAGATAANRTVIIMEFSCLFRVRSVCSVLLIFISTSLNAQGELKRMYIYTGFFEAKLFLYQIILA